MTEKPILFSAPMIPALLAGTKTQTRRALKNVTTSTIRWWEHTPVDGMWRAHDGLGQVGSLPCPYGGIGTRLWVRETWRTAKAFDHMSPTKVAADCLNAGYSNPWAPIEYVADGSRDETWDSSFGASGKTRPSLFMPRWASRITLEITDVRCERLQAISEEDARAEGAVGLQMDQGSNRPRFEGIWDSINGPGAWAKNPWVWVLTFKRVQP